jgi:uncharacterized protein
MEEDMQSKLVDERGGKRTFAVVLQTGGEAMRCLQDFAVKELIGGPQVTAIGALSGGQLAYFDGEQKQYRPVPGAEQVEVASAGRGYRHRPKRPAQRACPCRAWRRDGRALAVHLLEARVRPTLEIIITESPAHLCKAKHAESGLALIKL